MVERKKINSRSASILIIIILSVSLYFVYTKLSEQNLDPVNAIPESSAIFGDFKSLRGLDEEFYNNELWRDLILISPFEEYRNLYPRIDSVLQNNRKLNDIFKNNRCIISVHPKDLRNELLLILKLEGKSHKANIDRFFREVFGASFTKLKSAHLNTDIHKLIFNQYEKTFSFAFIGDLLIASVNEELVRESISRLKSNQNISSDLYYKELTRTAGKKVDGNLYINFKQISNFLNAISSQKNTGYNEKVFNFSNWAELDLIIKKDEILLNGYSTITDSTQHFADLFFNQEAQEVSMDGILPFHISFLFHYGFQDFKAYFENLKTQKKSLNKFESFNRKITTLNTGLKSNIEESFVKYIGTEVALFSLASNAAEIEAKSYVVFNSNNLPALKQQLDQISKRVRNSGLIKKYKGVDISRISKTRIPETLFGENFKAVSNFNYIIINGYVIVANSSESLEAYITHYQSGKTLDLNNNYKIFSDNISRYSNIYIYFNFRNGLGLLEEYFKADLYEVIKSNAAYFRNIHAAACQFSNINNRLFTSFYIKYNPSIVEENRSVWKVNLDNDVVGQPYLIRNHRNNTYNIIAFDVDNKMYLFNSEGDLLWKRAINEPVISEVQAVDYYKNGKIQYLFNTKKFIHLIDLLGRNVENYPIRLNQEANNGLALFDYSKDRNYRILISGTDKKTYNFNIEGKQVSGWTKAQSLNHISVPLQHLSLNRRDYIFMADDNGKIRILNRQGNDRIILNKSFTKSVNSDFYINATNSKGEFLTTSNTGELTYISTNGNLNTTVFGNFSAAHYFLYEDFNNDNYKDFIYLDNNILQVFDRFKKLIFSYQFKNAIQLKPQMIHLSKSESLFGVVSDQSSEIFLFNKKGEVMISSGLIGETPFVLKSLKNNAELNLIVGEGSSLYNYIIR